MGEEIVGTCEDDQIFEQGADARQRTSTGSFFFDARRNRVIFRDSVRTWISGATGINFEVTVDRLDDGTGVQEPLVAPAVAVFNLGLLQPGNLGPRWTHNLPPRLMPDFTEPDCSTLPEVYGLPSAQLSLFDQEHGRTALHQLSAAPAWAVQPLRPRLERFAAACDGWTDAMSPDSSAFHFSLEPLLDLGDESLALKVEQVQAGAGARRAALFGFVRDGGLTSTLMVDSIRDEPNDDLRAALEWLARRAHGRLQDVARVLRI